MKQIISCLFLLFGTISLASARGACADPEVIQRLQELQRCISTIKSKVTIIQDDVDDLDIDLSGIDELSVQISILGEVLCSKIDNIQVAVTVSGLDELISASDVLLCSKIEDLAELVSTNDELILSSIDVHASDTDALVCSKVGDLDDIGSCLETLIDVPDDINNLNLNTIELLKTILLELRGCNQC